MKTTNCDYVVYETRAGIPRAHETSEREIKDYLPNIEAAPIHPNADDWIQEAVVDRGDKDHPWCGKSSELQRLLTVSPSERPLGGATHSFPLHVRKQPCCNGLAFFQMTGNRQLLLCGVATVANQCQPAENTNRNRTS